METISHHKLLLALHTVNHALSFCMHIGCLPYMNTCIRHALISHPGTITWTSRQVSQLKPQMYISNKSFSWEHFFSHWVFFLSTYQVSAPHFHFVFHMYISFHNNQELIASSATPTYINATSTITKLPTMSSTNAFTGTLRIRQGGMICQDQEDH